MKRILCFVLLAVMLASMFVPVYAGDAEPETVATEDGGYITYFSDGSMLTVSGAVESDISVISSSTGTRKNATKYVEFTNSKGEVEWRYDLTATFEYVAGQYANCIDAKYNETIYKTSWHFSDGSATKSGNTATGEGTFKYKVLFLTTNTQNVYLTISCDKNGNIS